jgi:hypothetical protein
MMGNASVRWDVDDNESERMLVTNPKRWIVQNKPRSVRHGPFGNQRLGGTFRGTRQVHLQLQKNAIDRRCLVMLVDAGDRGDVRGG